MTGVDVAEQLFAAVMQGDLGAVSDLYASDAVIWHNYDPAEQSKEDNLKILGWLIRNTSGLRYEGIRRPLVTVPFPAPYRRFAVRRRW
jgi:uncharacterized protein